MVLPAARVIESATPQSSAASGQVAPTAPAQGNVGVPGVYSPVTGSQNPVQGSQQQQQPSQNLQPGVQQPNIAGAGFPASPQIDPQVQQERAARLRSEQELANARQVLGQIQQAAQENQQTQQFQDRLRMVQATYDSLPADQAGQYLTGQLQSLIGEVRTSERQQLQQQEQLHQQQIRLLAAPMYAEDLGRSLGMTADAIQELKELGDPEFMYKQAPLIKARYDRFNEQLSQFQGNQVQLARSQEVAALSQAGLGAFGGQTAGGDYQIEVSDDPDERAMQIWAHLKERDAARAR